MQQPNAYLSALSRAQPGRPLRDGNLLWQRAGHLVVAERLRLNTAHIVAACLPRKALSNTWWPVAAKDGTADERRATEQILGLWLNSTLGLVTLIAARVDTEGPWMQTKKPLLTALPVLDPARLTAQQRAELAQLYDQVKELGLARIPHIAGDAVRAQIDAGLMEVLGSDANLMVVRELLAYEPLLRPAAVTPGREPTAAPVPAGGVEQLPLIPATAGRRPLARARRQPEPAQSRRGRAG